MKYYAKINFTIDKDHPDIQCVKECVKDWTENKMFDFDDTYTFDEGYDGFTEDDYINYIKRDLKLVAGGGYNWDHIHNVTFEIKEV